MGLCASKSDLAHFERDAPVTKRTKPSSQTTTKSNSKPKKNIQHKQKTSKQKGENRTLKEGTDENKEKLSPAEAARLAAEKRLQDSNDRFTKGDLGKKLAEERSKSHKSQLVLQAENQRLNKANEELVYD